MNKTVLQSKTFWVQILTVVCAFIPQVQSWVSQNPETFVGVLAAVNVIVRFATSGKVTLFSDK